MANIREYLNNIKNAIFGKDVRSSIHDGIDAINNEVISNTNLTNNTKVRQDLLEDKYDAQIAELANEEPQLPEIVDARSGFDTLGNTISKKTYFFNNVAEMKACNKLKNGDCVQTLGYYSANDGGSGTYQIVNDSTLVDDGGSVHDITNGLKAKLIIKDSINVKQFGAKGDGTYNDTTHIKNAINYMIAKFNSNNYSVKTLHFPNGNYVINSTITIPNFIILQSEENVVISSYCNTISILFDNVNINSSVYYHYTGERVKGTFTLEYKGSGESSIGIQFQSNASIPGTGNFNAWNIFKNFTLRYFNRAINLIMKNLFLKTFKNILIENCNYGVYFNELINNSGERFTFDNCTIGDSNYGFYSKCDDLELNIINSSIDFTSYGTTINASGGVVKFTNCHFEGAGFKNNGDSDNSSHPYIFKNIGDYFKNNIVMFTNCELMTMRDIPIRSSALYSLNVILNGFTTKGSAHSKDVYELCDDNCVIVTNNLWCSIYAMMITQKKMNLKTQPMFQNLETQTIANNGQIAGYTFEGNGSDTTSIVDTKYHTQGGKSIKYIVPSGGRYFTIQSEEFDCAPGQKLVNSFWWYYQGESEKSIRTKIQTTFYDKFNNIIPYPSNAPDDAINYLHSTSNEWNRPYQFEQIMVPAKAVKATTKYVINPIEEGTLYLTDFYRMLS